METYLAQVPLLQRLPRAELRRLEALCELRHFQKGETLFEEGQPAESVWIIRLGWVHLTRRTPQGGLVTIFTMTPDDAVCGVSAFDANPYAATAVAATDVQALKIPAAVFSTWLDRYPGFAKQVLLTCCLRIRHMADMIRLASATVEQRLAYTLLRLRATFGDTVPITHQELARMAGTRWETSIRTIATLRRQGWLSTSRGKMAILRPEKLNSLLKPPTNGTSASPQPSSNGHK